MKLKHFSISNRITLLISILFGIIMLVGFSIVIYSFDLFIGTKKNYDLASQTIDSLKAMRDSNEAAVSHGEDYHFYVIGSISVKNDPLSSRNVNNKMLVFPKNARISISKSKEKERVIMQIQQEKYELQITENITENSKSQHLKEKFYYFCVPFEYENLRYYIISLYDAANDIAFKNQIIDLLVFNVFVGIGIIVVFSNILIRTSLEPLIDLASEAINIDIAKSDKRLNIPNTNDEIAVLAVKLNQMLDNIDTSYQKAKQFTQDASHELRIPLTVILGNVELIQNFSEDSEIVKESIDAIQSEAQRMKTMIERLLMITRIESRNFSLNREEIRLKKLLHSVSDEMGNLYGRLIKVKCPEIVVITDRHLLVQLFRAIIDNAIKYSANEVIVSAETLNEDALVKIIDFGSGIKSTDLSLIKERFYRTDASRNSSTGGTGLGLSIAESIMQTLGGTLEIDSEYGEGTVVTLRFPLQI